MLALVVLIEVPPVSRDRFLAAIRAQAEASLAEEPGCLRFDVCAVEDDPARFVLYEVYADEAAFEAHGHTPHFARWRQAAEDCGLALERTLTRIVS
ncbi:MAG TPA: putative quinol monooxygenase [Gaiellaceae bacterium]|nr:putative quinol monooxygenase [Gaiellaceae bacterium]